MYTKVYMMKINDNSHAAQLQLCDGFRGNYVSLIANDQSESLLLWDISVGFFRLLSACNNCCCYLRWFKNGSVIIQRYLMRTTNMECVFNADDTYHAAFFRNLWIF